MSDPDPIPPELAADDPPFYDETLDVWLEASGILREPPGPFDVSNDVAEAGRWTVTDTGSAEWAMAKVAAIDAELAAAHAHATEYHDRIDRWFADQTQRATRRRAHLAGLLERYAIECRAAGGPATLRLVGGNVSTTKHREAVEIIDPDTVLAWAQDHLADVVTTTAKVLVSDLRKVAEPTRVPDGWEWCALLDCGHQLIEHTYKDPAEHPAPYGWVVGGVAECPECSDALADHTGRIDQLTADVVTMVVAAVAGEPDPESGEIVTEPVPGTRVKPATVTAKVVPA